MSFLDSQEESLLGLIEKHEEPARYASNQPRGYTFYHRECDHFTATVYKNVGFNTTALEQVPQIMIQSTEFCNVCMSAVPQELVSKRRFIPEARSDDIRRRTQAIWTRLSQNPGLIDPNDLTPFGDFVQHDINYLVVLSQDLENELFFRWAKPQELGQPTFAERQLFLQARDAVQQGLIAHLEGEGIPQEEVHDEIWSLELKPRKTLFVPAIADIDEKTGLPETDCSICICPYFNPYSRAPVRGAPCSEHCHAICRNCAVELINGPEKLSNITGEYVRPCPYCTKDWNPSGALMAPINEEEYESNPSPPWMDIFRGYAE